MAWTMMKLTMIVFPTSVDIFIGTRSRNRNFSHDSIEGLSINSYQIVRNVDMHARCRVCRVCASLQHCCVDLKEETLCKSAFKRARACIVDCWVFASLNHCCESGRVADRARAYLLPCLLPSNSKFYHLSLFNPQYNSISDFHCNSWLLLPSPWPKFPLSDSLTLSHWLFRPHKHIYS